MTRHLLVTRHPDECRELAARLAPAGWTVRPFPVLRLEEIEDAEGWSAAAAWEASELRRAWLVVASPRGPRRFVRRAEELGLRRLLDLPTAAVGDATAEAARGADLRVELVGPGTGAGLAELLLPQLSPGARVLFACGWHRRPELPDRLAAAGHPVQPVVVYRMQPTPPRELPPLGARLDAVVLTSPRAARYYLEGVGGLPLPCQHWALGPTTRDAAASLGIHCLTPPEPNLESLAEELCRS